MGSARDRSALWVTLRGASRWVAVVWVGWMGLALTVKVASGTVAGPGGAAVALLTIGWLLARVLPRPPACFTRFHLDDQELTVLGPGWRVVRSRWERLERVRQGRRTLDLEGSGVRIALPLVALQQAGAWFAVLGRTVPAAAEGLWEALETGMVTLKPEADPAWGALGWWAYAPAGGACLATGDVVAAGLVVVVAAGERLLTTMLRRRRVLALHPGGLVFRAGRGSFVPWGRATVASDPRGLLVGVDHGMARLVAADLPNFWAAAAVIHLRAQVGNDCPPQVHFRLRLSNGSLAVVGEIDASS